MNGAQAVGRQQQEFTRERRWDRVNLTLKDWIQIIALAAALVAQYVAIDRRVTVVETKLDVLFSGRLSGGK